MRQDFMQRLPPKQASRLPLLLGAAFALECVVLGWSPHDRSDWLLENVIAIPAAMLLVLGRRRLALSSTSWVLVFAFLGLHEIGSHYTYSFVPWMDWTRESFGWRPALQRNHFDRFVHFAFGFLLTRPLAEWIRPMVVQAKPARVRLFAVCVVMALSSLYELIEWTAAQIFDPGLGIAFVGAQGDIWDSQKDQSLALIGSVMAILLMWVSSRLVASKESGLVSDGRA